MKAISFDEVSGGDQLLFRYTTRSGCIEFLIITVIDIDKEDHSIISNLNNGLNIYPNEDDQYILINKNKKAKKS